MSDKLASRVSMLFGMLIASALVALSQAYPNGAGGEVCNEFDLQPKHDGTEVIHPPQSDFKVNVSQSEYTPGGEPLLVTLYGGQFKGFLILARKSRVDVYARGRFTRTPFTQVRCQHSAGSGVTHMQLFTRLRESSLQLQWNPPTICEASNIGPVTFQASVVVGFSEAHTKIYSKEIEMAPLNNTLLCANGCGVNCPLTTTPCPPDKNCTMDDGAGIQKQLNGGSRSAAPLLWDRTLIVPLIATSMAWLIS